ncbi:pilus assembly protein PilZ [Aureimonas endophytica]|uniref:Pilus assembly protein PilZ n=1 Tax=Aureimonas endophytica TaxID=2027858 RepID=A0A916ZEG0_9HYPH|nr:PilZ domain-containing protein [Aureimonas endophytica]GGD90507.1 pilus assembly protein PilZ [Aureimonas endophytica]
MSALAAPPLGDFQERRHYHRIPLSLLGRFMLEDRSEYPCRLKDMSPGDVALLTPARARLGEHVILYVDQLGRFEGKVKRLFAGGFALAVEMTERKREKLAAQLTWLANRSELNLPEDRRHERLQPHNPVVQMVLEDGRKYQVRIIDLSLSGAALQAEVRPAVGSRILLGHTQSRVVRLLEEGFAVEFVVAKSLDNLSEL